MIHKQLHIGPSQASRAFAAMASSAIIASVAAALLSGLQVRMPRSFSPKSLITVEFPPQQTPPPPHIDPTPTPRPIHLQNSDPAPAGGKSAPLALPPPPIVLAQTPSFFVAKAPGNGNSAGNGTALSGDGTGSGGTGRGNGDDVSTNRNVATFPRQYAGSLRYSDLPDDLREARTGGELTVRYRIGVDGRPTDCITVASSGRPDLDALTCARIIQKFRFRPARDPQGRPVPFVMIETHGWDNTPSGS